jgi:pyruvate dehydrogenase E1 component alpha subunit
MIDPRFGLCKERDSHCPTSAAPYDEESMPMVVTEEFKVSMLKVLDEEGNCDNALKPDLTDDQIKRLYELMILTRTFDDLALKLQREGRIGTYPSSRGQEATQVASAYALGESDWLFPAFREAGAYIARGWPLEMQYQYWAGDERGSRLPDNIRIFTISIPVGTQVPHAVGFAWAAKLKGNKIAVLAYLGDGATSEGDAHEGMNFAGVFKVPVVILCQNNQWAISVPRSRQTAAKTLAQRAFSYGFEGIQVDGNDVFAVYKATKDALDKARSGNGPTLVECVTYRMADHTTSDDAQRYRTNQELEEWAKRDPIERLRKYMKKNSLWSSEYEKKVQTEASEKVRVAVEKFESVKPQEVGDMFAWTYAELPSNLRKQYEELAHSLGGRD